MWPGVAGTSTDRGPRRTQAVGCEGLPVRKPRTAEGRNGSERGDRSLALRAPSRSRSGRSGTTEGAGAAGAEEAAPQEAAKLGPHRRARIQDAKWVEKDYKPRSRGMKGTFGFLSSSGTAKPRRQSPPPGHKPGSEGPDERGCLCTVLPRGAKDAQPHRPSSSDGDALPLPRLLHGGRRRRGWLPAARVGRARTGEERRKRAQG